MRYLSPLSALAALSLGTAAALAQPVTPLPSTFPDPVFQCRSDTPVVQLAARRDFGGRSTVADYVADRRASRVPYPASYGGSLGKGRCPGRVFGSLEYLYWRATRDATPYVGTLTRPSGTIGGLPIDSGSSLQSELYDTDYGREGAFRVNLGYRMNDCWDARFRYTYYSTTGDSALGDPTVDSDHLLANRLDRNLADDILDQAFDDGEADFASQHIDLDFNTYDLELRRRLCLASRRLEVGLMGGFRFADIDQTSRIRYQNLEGSETPVLLTADTDESMGMSAAGLRAGGDASYFVGWGTSVYARGAVSLLYADFDVARRDLQTSSVEAGVRSIRYGFQSIVPVVELNVGLRWQYRRFYVACGYDVSHWFDMVQGLDAIYHDDVDGTTNGYRAERGGLSFEGFSAEVGFSF